MAPTELDYTPLEDIEKIHDELKATFSFGKTKSIEFRKQQLAQLAHLINDNIDQFDAAMKEDLGNPSLEAQFLETSVALKDAIVAYNNVEKWSKTESADFSQLTLILGPKNRKEPKGIVLIITPWNYPIWLCLMQFISAIAAGCTVVVKPSELAPGCSKLLSELIPKYLDQSAYRIVNGGIPETTKLLELKWDHIVFTGNGKVGRIVAAAAAKHLTPTTLELGGKNPVILDPESDIELAAKRIAFGKFVNAGQSCTSPDYVLCFPGVQERLVDAFSKVYSQFYPDGPEKSDSFSRINNDNHFNRLKNMLSNTKGTIVLGGQSDASQRYLAPTIVKDVTPGDSLMSDEIFGPILALVPVAGFKEAISLVNSIEPPLAVYVFSQNSTFKEKVIGSTESGAAIINDTLIHPGIDGIPFGGFRGSGNGYMTGKFGFDTFSHIRPTLDSSKLTDLVLSFRYPPYTADKYKKMRSTVFTRSLPPRFGSTSTTSQKKTTWTAAVFAVCLVAAFSAKQTRVHTAIYSFFQRLIGSPN